MACSFVISLSLFLRNFLHFVKASKGILSIIHLFSPWMSSIRWTTLFSLQTLNELKTNLNNRDIMVFTPPPSPVKLTTLDYWCFSYMQMDSLRIWWYKKMYVGKWYFITAIWESQIHTLKCSVIDFCPITDLIKLIKVVTEEKPLTLKIQNA